MTNKFYSRVAFVLTLSLVVVTLNNCSSDSSSAPPVAASCTYSASSSTTATHYGAFDPSTMDQCNAYDAGPTSRWTGMAGATAFIALPTAAYANGAACGQCAQITGASGTVIARVAMECPGCAANEIDMDFTSFNAATGSAGGVENISVTLIPCPLTQDIRFSHNAGSNIFFQNISASNFKNPIATMEIDDGTGFAAMTRAQGAFTKAIGGAGAGATVDVRATDIFGQQVTATISSNAATPTATSVQFGNCE